jgi:hypothetical protein
MVELELIALGSAILITGSGDEGETGELGIANGDWVLELSVALFSALGASGAAATGVVLPAADEADADVAFNCARAAARCSAVGRLVAAATSSVISALESRVLEDWLEGMAA